MSQSSPAPPGVPAARGPLTTARHSARFDHERSVELARQWGCGTGASPEDTCVPHPPPRGPKNDHAERWAPTGRRVGALVGCLNKLSPADSVFTHPLHAAGQPMTSGRAPLGTVRAPDLDLPISGSGPW